MACCSQVFPNAKPFDKSDFNLSHLHLLGTQLMACPPNPDFQIRALTRKLPAAPYPITDLCQAITGWSLNQLSEVRFFQI